MVGTPPASIGACGDITRPILGQASCSGAVALPGSHLQALGHPIANDPVYGSTPGFPGVEALPRRYHRHVPSKIQLHDVFGSQTY